MYAALVEAQAAAQPMNPLVTALLDLAVRIGKAIARRLARWTVRRVVAWMRERIEVFRDRLGEATRERRKLWLRGRINRWTQAANWIEARALKALGEAARQVCKLPAFRNLPQWAACEKAVAA
jgi:hypothetical protein